MSKKIGWLLIFMSFITVGCTKEPVQVMREEIVDSESEDDRVVESITELKLETIDLHTLEPYEVMYTPYESDRLISTDTIQIEEYYNENTKLYSYVLTVKEKELEEISELTLYKIIKIDIGTLRDEEKGIYTLSASSPIFIGPPYGEDSEMDFIGQTYFLFNSSKRLFDEEFRVELVMIGEEGIDGGDDSPETFRLIKVSGGSIDGYTLVTD